VIKVEHISKQFKKVKAVDDVSLEVKKGEIVCLIGPSGSGKSTVLRCIHGLEVPETGHVYLNGEVLDPKKSNYQELRNKMGFVFQHFNLFPHMTVLENLTLSLTKVRHMEEEKANEIACNYLTRVGLLDKKDEYPNKLSGGQKQRISIARVFLKNPPILIFDEATSALDNESESIVQESLEKLSQDRTTFVIAHRLSTIKNAKHICVLTENGIEEQGNHEELMKLNGNYARLYNMQFKGEK
jgi:ABC-type polar amino acid transport system ATPase subunit